MEQLSLLQKIYLYGETLSSEELNQIVLYLNSSIEAINTLIARNNNINEGHCEMRYKVSAQLPEAPESGTDGKSNGWSDTYTKPDTANGEITWMTLSFFNGEGVYGAWSTPVCITWGSVQGQKGPKGDSGLKGSFKSRIFKRLNTRPDTPTGGTYDNPIPSEGGWTDGIPSGAAIIWSSVCTFYGNGLSSGWSVPAPESDSDTLDIEFSPNAVQPEPPTGDTPFSDHESEGWYDPSSNNFNIVGTMIWRAERKVSNGEYNGDWTITRIVGEKGDRGDSGLTGGHYEFRYNNFKPSEQASAPTKPETGSNGTTNGWTTSQETLTETLIKEGYATWMTQCYQNEASTYGIWTDPIRITGANGLDGEDGIDIEFVYTRREDVWSNPTPPPTTQTDDWPTNGNNHSATVNGVTWYDNPLGVTEVLMYEYVSLRLKVDDVWSAYSTPVIWSKWGEKGMDGDGFEYIYKRFQTIQNWANITGDDNPANWKTNHATEFLDTREYLGPTNKEWNDDPLGIDETYKYEYVSVRLEIDGVWYDYSTPTLWSGMPGVFLSRVFTRTNDDISNVTPSGGTYANPIPNNTVVGSGQNQKTYVWSDSVPSGEAIIWSSTCVFNGDGSSNGWSKPLKESDTANLDIEFTDANSANGSAAPAAPSGSTPFSDHSSETPAWYDPSSIPANTTMVWRAERKVSNGVYDGDWVITRIKGEKGDPGINGGNYEFRYANATSAPTKPTAGASGIDTTWKVTQSSLSESDIKSGYNTYMTHCFKTAAGTYGTWTDPIRITGANGRDGEDGSDIEFIYTTSNSATAPSAPTASGTGNSKTFTDNDWYGVDNNGVTWTDNPLGVTSSLKYEFISVREKPAGKNQSWGSYSTPAIWSKYGEKGMDGDGVQYIFKLFDTELNSTERSSTYKPTKEGITLTNGEWIPSGWNDDPPTVSSEHPYCYCSTIKKTNGTWGDFETLSLWAKYSKDGSNSTVPGPDGKGITYVLTRDTYSESNWSTYCAIDHSESFGRGSSDLGSSCRAGDFFIVKGTATDGQHKFHLATFKCTAFDNSNITGTCISHIKDGDKGESITGKTGPMFYIAGIWDSTTQYTKNDYKCPVVFYDDGTNERYYYLIASSSRNLNPSSNSSVWGLADNFEAIFTKVLFSNFAKLGSFIMNQDWMVSLHGVEYDSSGNLTVVSGDNTTNYLNFKPSSPTENLSGETNFCPNLAIDAKTGRVYAQRMDVGGSSTFKGTVYAENGTFNGNVNATLFKAGNDSGFSITTSSDSLNFNYNGTRLAFFSLRGWNSTNNQLADVSDNPTGFYLYMTNPLNGHLITIDFASLSFKDLNHNQVLRHEVTFYKLSNLSGKAVETPTTLYYSIEDGITKWWLHSDSATELTSSEMGTLYKKQLVNRGSKTYSACVQEVDAGTPYITTNYTLYELQTLQNNAPTKTGNYAMSTNLNTDGSSSTNKWFVVPNSTTYLNSLNTNWNGVYRLDDGRVKSTTATTVTQSSNRNTVPTFNLSVSFINSIDENGNVVSILYP